MVHPSCSDKNHVTELGYNIFVLAVPMHQSLYTMLIIIKLLKKESVVQCRERVRTPYKSQDPNLTGRNGERKLETLTQKRLGQQVGVGSDLKTHQSHTIKHRVTQIFFLLIFYVFQGRNRCSVWNFVLTLIYMCVLIFTHTLSTTLENMFVSMNYKLKFLLFSCRACCKKNQCVLYL